MGSQGIQIQSNESPFTGWKLKGKVKYTICDGKIIELYVYKKKTKSLRIGVEES